MKICPDCGGKIPESEIECPICGSPQDLYSFQDQEPAFSETKNDASPEKCFSGIRHFLWEAFLFIFALIAIGVIVLATDFKGARTELRRICMTDSGSGSESDTQLSRISVKYHILVLLNFFDHGGTGESTRINPHAFKRRHLPDPDSGKQELQVKKSIPLELPPTPPEVEPLDLQGEKSVKTPQDKDKMIPEKESPEDGNKSSGKTETVPAL